MRNSLRLLAVITALILVTVAADRFAAQDRLGFALLAAAGVMIALAAPPLWVRQYKTQAEKTESAPSAPPRKLRLFMGIALLIAGVIALVVAGAEFHAQLQITRSVNSIAWSPYVIGVVLTGIGGLLLTGIGKLPRPNRVTLVLLGIIVIALFLRVYLLDDFPFGVWFDEGVNGLHARDVLTTADFRPVFVDNMTMPHLALYGVMLQAFGTNNIVGMRLISALFGVGGVIAAYVVGRELRGDSFGLLMALILAAMRWSVNFSRIAMTGVEVVLFTLLAVYFALKLIRDGHLRYVLWLGITIGIGLLFYRGLQTQLIAVAFLLLFSYPFKRYGIRRILAHVTVGLAAIIVLALPLIIFAVDQSDVYFGRVDQVSIFNEDLPDGVTVNDALMTSITRHLEMFNLEGDRNGRHNLPRAPMLDALTGGLFVIGLIVALIRGWRRDLPVVNLAFALLLVLALVNGILTVSFEAPQGLRTIGAITGVTYFAALGVLALLQTLDAAIKGLNISTPSLQRGLVGVGVIALGAGIVWLNYNTYFNQQRHNLNSWRDFSTDATLVGKLYQSYPDNTRFFVSPFIDVHPSLQFLAESALDRSRTLVIPDILPIRAAPEQLIVYMLTPAENLYLEPIRRMYPDAVIRPIRPVDYGVDTSPDNVLFNIIEFAPDVLRSVQGLENGEGILYMPIYGDYAFDFPAGASLTLDGDTIERGETVRLVQGDHALQVSPPNAAISWTIPATATMSAIPSWNLFHDPVTLNGVRVEFYSNGDWEGSPAIRSAPTIYQQIHILPMQRPYSTRYLGQLYAPEAGNYIFHLTAITTAELLIDGESVLQTQAQNQRVETSITLAQGWHDIEARHQDLSSNSRIFLTWQPPNAPNPAPIPQINLCPVADLCN